MSTEVKEFSIDSILANAGINVDDFDVCTDDETISISDIESSGSFITSVEQKPGNNFILMPLCSMKVDFDIRTGKKLPKGKVFSSIQLKVTPMKMINIIMEVIENSPEAKSNYEKTLKVKFDDIDTSHTEYIVNTDLFDLFSGYINFYTVNEIVQKFNLGEEFPSRRKSPFVIDNRGMIDFDNSDQELSELYKMETALYNKQLEIELEEAKRNFKDENAIKTIKSNLRQARIMSTPFESFNSFIFAFPCDTNGVITPEVEKDLNSPTVNLKKYLKYFRTNSYNFISHVKKVINTEKDSCRLNVIPLHYSIPEKTTEMPTDGACINKATITSAYEKQPIWKKVPDIDKLISEFLSEEDNLDLDFLKDNISEYKEVSKDIIKNAYSSGISRYQLALSSPEIVGNYQRQLTGIGCELSKQAIIEITDSIDVKEKEETKKVLNVEEAEEEGMYDDFSEDKASFDDFIEEEE